MTIIKSKDKFLVLISIVILSSVLSNAQNVRSIDASNTTREIKSGHLKMGNPGYPGHELLVNNQYMTIGGKPIIPVMGEMHYSRYPKEQWEDAILKMKANGINIIAFYVIWIHHEEIEGQFDFSGNKDLRSFIKLCQKHGLLVYPRIGPWAHGEVRNGGTPDWILKKRYLVDRSNDPVYQSYVERYIKQIAGQMNGLMFKDGGPIIGVQLENEYWRGHEGDEHILWLKKTVLKYGIDVPLYTVTGWGNASVPENEVIPLFGAYPGAPWNSDLEKIKRNPAFEFNYNPNDENIGSDQKKATDESGTGRFNYPFFTCELGVGNQISQHRRPVFDRFDGLAIVTAKIGSGSNLPGYYVFTGGSNPEGILTSMEENREETGYWVSYPRISYDFQAAVKETGELAPSYYQVKKMHYFLNEFGENLAPMIPVIARVNDPIKDLQYCVRVKDNSGFLFGINYYRGTPKPEQKNVQFNIKLKDENLLFPSQPVNIPDSCIFIWPFNFRMDKIILKYSTAQPLCRIDQKDRTDWFFIQDLGIQPEFCFDASLIKSVESVNGKISKINNQYIITGLVPGINNYIKIINSDNREQHVIVLSYEESEKIWLFNSDGNKHLFLSDADLYLNNDQLHVFGPRNNMKLIILSDKSILNPGGRIPKQAGNYKEYDFTVPLKTIDPVITSLPVLYGAENLKASVKSVSADNQLYNKVFVKEFDLDNPSAIRSAKLIFASDIPGKIRINNMWLNQEIVTGKVNQLDITGYLQKVKNQIVVDFPFNGGEKVFAAKIRVEFMNSDEVTIVTDQSWLTLEQYTIPSSMSEIKGLERPEIAAGNYRFNDNGRQKSYEYLLNIPDDYMNGLNQLYLHVDYNGDKGELRYGHKLIADNFNNFTPWQIALKKFGKTIEGQQIKIELYPFEPDFKIYFDKPLSKDQIEKTVIRALHFIPEYSIDLLLEQQHEELPRVTFTLPGTRLKSIAEKILYKNTPQEDMYLYLLRPEGSHKNVLPAIIYFTGGGWVDGSVESQIANAAWFRDRGIIGIDADYRVQSRHGTTPIECIRDAKSAVRYIREHAVELGIDPDKIIVAGGSAGGHIAACTAIDGGDEPGENLEISSKPNALVLHNPVLGEGFGEKFFAVHPEFSPVLNVRKGWPPTILSCGTKDSTTPFAVAKKFTDLMKAAGNICELIPVKDAEHSCDWPVSNPNFLPTLTRMADFLHEQHFITDDN
jgi:acetyl esterase/lipase